MIKSIACFLLLAAHALAQTTFTLPSVAAGEPSLSVTVSATAVSNLTAWVQSTAPNLGWPNASGAPVNTTLQSSISSTDTALSLATSTNVQTCNGLLIDSEVIAVVSNAGTVTVVRGMIGTAKTSHSSGAVVTVLRSGDYTCFLKSSWADAISQVVAAKLQGAAIVTQSAAKAAADAAILALMQLSVQ